MSLLIINLVTSLLERAEYIWLLFTIGQTAAGTISFKLLDHYSHSFLKQKMLACVNIKYTLGENKNCL